MRSLAVLLLLCLAGYTLNADPKDSLEGSLVKIGEVATGHGPKSVMFTPDGRFLIAALLFGSGIEVYSVDPLRRVKAIGLDGSVTGFVELAYNHSRGELWVSQMLTNSIHILDSESFDPLRVIPSGGEWPKVIAFSPDEKTAYASHWISRDVSFIDVRTGQVQALVPISGVPRGLAVTPDGGALLVANFTTGALEIVNIENQEVSRVVESGPGAMRHLVLDREGKTAYASDMYTGRVTAIDLTDGTFIKSRRLASNPNTIVLTNDGKYLFVSCRGRNNDVDYRRKSPENGKIFVLDTATLEVVDWIRGGNQPTGLALSPDGSLMAFSNFHDNTIELYRIDEIRFP